MFQINENTRCFHSRCCVLESYREPGMILLQVLTEEASINNLVTRTGLKTLGMTPLSLENKDE